MSRWVRRGAVALAVGAGVLLGASVLGYEPDPLRVLLLCVVVVASAAVLIDAVPRSTVVWYPVPTHPSITRGRDSATQAHLRHLENHQATRHPDDTLQRRLLALTDRVLRVRHGVGVDSTEGRALLGPDLREVLEGRVVRLSPRRIDQVLRHIEEL